MSSYSEAIRRAADSGSFGDSEVVNIELDEEKHKGFQLASNLFFVKVNLFGDLEKYIVVKNQPYHRRSSEVLFRDSLFVNEVCFYNDLLPFLSIIDPSIKSMFPKFIYGYASDGKDASKDTVIVEDLNPFGYRTSETGKDLDMDHLTLALKSLGRFHALSYRAKKENPSCFKILMSNLKNDAASIEDFLVSAMYSTPNCYKSSPEESSKLQEFCCKDPLKHYQNSLIPKEPNAVLCHGDFCSNNLLFFYKENKPEDIKLIDMQRCRYASPAIDLSFFLLYNTTKQTKPHWDFFLHVYYESLRSTYPDVSVPSFDEFIHDFIEHIVYGVTTCSYFFRIISLPNKELNDFLMLEKNDKKKCIGKLGGPGAIRLIEEMVQLLFSKHYL